MIKLGPESEEMRPMSFDDIFLSRLKLLIIMAKAYLKDYPIGKYRKSAIIENAHHIFYHSLQLSSQINLSENFETESQLVITSEMDKEEERKFHQRVQLLAVMIKAAAENRRIGIERRQFLYDQHIPERRSGKGRLTENFKKKALQENLDRICDTLIFKFHLKDFEFLKVA